MADVFVQGWTERIKYALARDGVALDLTGLSVALVGQDKNGNAIAFTGSVGIDTALTGLVYFDPAVTDLVMANAPYHVRWKVTDGAGKIAYFPRADALRWDVYIP